MSSLAKRKEKAVVRDFPSRAVLLRNMPQYAGAHADYRRDHYIFPRTQSPEMRSLEWDERAEPLRRWGSNMVANLAWSIFS